MIKYSSIILDAVKNSGKKYIFPKDPNKAIDSVLAKTDLIEWYPTYLLINKNEFLMFRPFSCKSILDEKELKRDCTRAAHLIRSLKTKKISPKIYFIVSTNEDIELLERQKLSSDFGILLYDESSEPCLYPCICDIFQLKCKILPGILKYLTNAKNLKGKIGDKIRNFSKKYLKEKPSKAQEEILIKTFLNQLLKSSRIDAAPIMLIKEMENIVASVKGQMRDHYFHAFNTMMVGFMIIDKFYSKFSNFAKKYGNDIDVELLWALISLHHDIGYPILLVESLECETFAIDREEDRQRIREGIKQQRKECWKSANYELMVKVLDDLFNHVNKGKANAWAYDAFSRDKKTSKFRNGLEKCFVDEGAHGAAGTLKLAVLTNKYIRSVSSSRNREFLYRHMALAALSILFHDRKVREIFRSNKILIIKAKNFPFCLLLTYVDILQDDRRDITGTTYNPDILERIDNVNDNIKAVLDRKTLNDTRKQNILEELKEAFSFFEMDGIRFLIPAELR